MSISNAEINKGVVLSLVTTALTFSSSNRHFVSRSP